MTFSSPNVGGHQQHPTTICKGHVNSPSQKGHNRRIARNGVQIQSSTKTYCSWTFKDKRTSKLFLLTKKNSKKNPPSTLTFFPFRKKVHVLWFHAFFGHDAPWVWCRKIPSGNDLKHPIHCLQFTWGLRVASLLHRKTDSSGDMKKNNQPTTHTSNKKTHTFANFFKINKSTHIQPLFFAAVNYAFVGNSAYTRQSTISSFFSPNDNEEREVVGPREKFGRLIVLKGFKAETLLAISLFLRTVAANNSARSVKLPYSSSGKDKSVTKVSSSSKPSICPTNKMPKICKNCHRGPPFLVAVRQNFSASIPTK